MSDRLKALADAVDPAFIMDNDARDDLRRQAAALLRAASAETVGTEWDDDPVRFPYPTRARQRHNSDLHAARLAIAAAKAERDAKRGELEAAEQHNLILQKHSDEIHAALAAEKQRAIDEALAAWDDWYQRDGVIDNVEAALRPHATKATEGQIRTAAHYTPAEVEANVDAICDRVKEAKQSRLRNAVFGPGCSTHPLDEPAAPVTTPNSVAHKFASVINRNSLEAGSNTPDWIVGEFLETCRSALNEAIQSRDRYYGVSHTPATTQPAAVAAPATDACDTRELVARLAGVVALLAEDHGSGIMRSECEDIIAIVRRGGVA